MYIRYMYTVYIATGVTSYSFLAVHLNACARARSMRYRIYIVYSYILAVNALFLRARARMKRRCIINEAFFVESITRNDIPSESDVRYSLLMNCLEVTRILYYTRHAGKKLPAAARARSLYGSSNPYISTTGAYRSSQMNLRL